MNCTEACPKDLNPAKAIGEIKQMLAHRRHERRMGDAHRTSSVGCAGDAGAGMKELDVLLTRYVEERYAGASRRAQEAFRALLEAPDPLIHAYCLGLEPPRPPSSPPSSSASREAASRRLSRGGREPLLEFEPVRKVTLARNTGKRHAFRNSSNFSLAESVYRDRLGCELAGLGSRMSVEESDLKLVERVQRGERAAFDLLVLRYQHKVLKLIMRYVHDATEAEDIAQEAFVKAYRALQSFRGDSAFYTWLYRIAINTAKNALVATKRRPMDYDLDLQDPEQYDLHSRLAESETPEALLLTDEIRDTVNRAIENLPEDLRTAIVLRELEGLSYEDIAQTMDCPVGTVRSRIFRAREAIDKKLRPIFEGGLGRPEDT